MTQTAFRIQRHFTDLLVSLRATRGALSQLHARLY